MFGELSIFQPVKYKGPCSLCNFKIPQRLPKKDSLLGKFLILSMECRIQIIAIATFADDRHLPGGKKSPRGEQMEKGLAENPPQFQTGKISENMRVQKI